MEEFIQKVVSQVHTEEEAQAIREELTDHIMSLIHDYMENGYSQEVATHKTLLQMGDPKEIGYSFTDYQAMKIRKMKLIGSKILSGLLVFGLIAFLMVVSSGEGESLQQTQGNESAGESFFGSMGYILFQLLYLPLLFFNASRSTAGQYGIPVRRIRFQGEPLMILWPYKKRFPWEYWFFGVFFLPLVIVFLILYAYEGGNPFYFFGFFAVIGMAVYVFFWGERFRIPKYVVYEEGIQVGSMLITWASIDRLTWVSDYRSHHKGNSRLMMEHLYRASLDPKRSNNMMTKRYIEVNQAQSLQLKEIIKKRYKDETKSVLSAT